MNSSILLPLDILVKIGRDFSPADSPAVLQLLEGFRALHPDLGDRITRSIIFVAEGDVDKFTSAVALAKLDWRDLIVQAEYDGCFGEEHRRRDLNLPFASVETDRDHRP